MTGGRDSGREADPADRPERAKWPRKVELKWAVILGELIVIVVTAFGLGLQIWWDRVASEKELSAYLWVQFAGTPILNRDEHTWTVRLQLNNMGQTPARHVITLGPDFAIAPPEQGQPYVQLTPLEQVRRNPLIIGYVARETSLPITAAEFFPPRDGVNIADDVQESGSWLYVFGTVWFRDIYDGLRWLTYCHRYTAGKEPEPCRYGNDTGRLGEAPAVVMGEIQDQ